MNTLVCIGKIIEHLDKFLLIDDIFPAMRQIPSNEPAVLMAILGNVSFLQSLCMMLCVNWYHLHNLKKA